MEELNIFLGFMPAFIAAIIMMTAVYSTLSEVVFNHLTKVFPPVAFAAGVLAASVAVVGTFGLPTLISLLFLGAASAAFWNDHSGEIPTVCVVEEYLDGADLARLIELGERGLALQAEDERETARRRIAELEADNLRLVAMVAQACKPAATELLRDNQAVLAAWDYVELLFDATDCPDPGWRPAVAHA